jgi:hypothetical protein
MSVRSCCFAIVIVAILVTGVACIGTKSPASVSLGQKVTLAIGQSISVTAEPLALTFAKVVNDSRCPTGVECFWAGEVSCLVDIIYQDKMENVVLTESGAYSKSANKVFNQYRIAFHVTPHPQAGIQIRSEDYRLQLTITRTP